MSCPSSARQGAKTTTGGSGCAWIGLDIGKAGHHATEISAAGETMFDRPVVCAIERLLDAAGEGIAIVIDHRSSIGSGRSPLPWRAAVGIRVVHVPGS